MSNFNQCILMGNMTRDPQLSYLPNQTAVVDFGLAVNRTFKKSDGSQGDEICFVDCKIFGSRAEVINKHFSKGHAIFVVGHLKFEQWEKDGAKHSKLRVIVDRFEFIGKKPDSE